MCVAATDAIALDLLSDNLRSVRDLGGSRTRYLHVRIMCVTAVLDYSAKSTGIQSILEYPKGVAGEISACLYVSCLSIAR